MHEFKTRPLVTNTILCAKGKEDQNKKQTNKKIKKNEIDGNRYVFLLNLSNS